MREEDNPWYPVSYSDRWIKLGTLSYNYLQSSE